MASEPSGSSKANEREDTEPGEYDEGSFTHEGRWVIVRVAYEGLSASSESWHWLGEAASVLDVAPVGTRFRRMRDHLVLALIW